MVSISDYSLVYVIGGRSGGGWVARNIMICYVFICFLEMLLEGVLFKVLFYLGKKVNLISDSVKFCMGIIG